MNYLKLRKLNKKIYFSIDDIAKILNINISSARVLGHRYVKNSAILRVKRNFYILREKWENLNQVEFYKITNLLQVPSYISFATALNFHEVTTQVQRNFFESASIKRTRKFEIEGIIFNYYKLKPELYFDFEKRDGIFIASPEKAFLDCVYLYSYGKYKFDINSIHLEKINLSKLKKLLKNYPDKTRELIKKLCKI